MCALNDQKLHALEGGDQKQIFGLKAAQKRAIEQSRPVLLFTFFVINILALSAVSRKVRLMLSSIVLMADNVLCLLP